MSLILDCHTHHLPPQPEAIVCASPLDFDPLEEQLYSVGIHPWNPQEATEENFRRLEDLSAHPQVVAIGEAGVDAARKNLPMFAQLIAFRRQIEISERIGKPLIIHDVKAHDIIIGMLSEYKPRQPWIIHGFRAKPTVAQMLLRAGKGNIRFSLGEKFNPESLSIIPTDRILAETDESTEDISAIINAISEAKGIDMLSEIAANTAETFRL